MKLSPLAFLYYVAPLCAVVLALPVALLELPKLSAHQFHAVRRVGVLTLLLNASVAFALNLATMALIKNTSALTLNVSGVFKDLLLILWSVVVSGAIVTPTQYFGYAIAVAGVSAYSHYKRTQASQPTVVAPIETAEEEAKLKSMESESGESEGGRD